MIKKIVLMIIIISFSFIVFPKNSDDKNFKEFSFYKYFDKNDIDG